MTFTYDVVVVGAGHAGCEAATAAARLGAKTLLVTIDMTKIAEMSCNPAVGGIAKGQIVREIDALGGHMGIVADSTAIQRRMLNRSKGPAVWSPRAQCDRGLFTRQWRRTLEETPNLDMWQDEVTEITTERRSRDDDEADTYITGVKTIWGVEIKAPCVIITAGTFLNGLMHIGRSRVKGGRMAERAAERLTESITARGIRAGRMKTGTPVRLDKRYIHFEDTARQDGDKDSCRFSFLSDGDSLSLPALPCWILYTNEEAHATLRASLADSPLYNGQIQSVGPRYCPSIETKLTVFPDRDHHQLFLEPEGTDTNEMYLNGFSSSLPIDAQINALRHIPALRDVKAYRPGYAIEYDFFDPTQLRHTLESKKVRGLFLAGQVNGTTGYEEAAGQGVIAGVNAALRCHGGQPFLLRRDEAYIGVLIDDLTIKGVDEPYRMFTSRAEYRILLRQDNADGRLTPRAYELGLAGRDRYDRYMKKQKAIDALTRFCRERSVRPEEINLRLQQLGTAPLNKGCRLIELTARPGVTMKDLKDVIPELNEETAEVLEETEISVKYAGYAKREKQMAEKARRLENIHIRGHFNYAALRQLSIEAREKLTRADPDTLAEASRVPGVSPADIDALLVLMGR